MVILNLLLLKTTVWTSVQSSLWGRPVSRPLEWRGEGTVPASLRLSVIMKTSTTSSDIPMISKWLVFTHNVARRNGKRMKSHFISWEWVRHIESVSPTKCKLAPVEWVCWQLSAHHSFMGKTEKAKAGRALSGARHKGCSLRTENGPWCANLEEAEQDGTLDKNMLLLLLGEREEGKGLGGFGAGWWGLEDVSFY